MKTCLINTSVAFANSLSGSLKRFKILVERVKNGKTRPPGKHYAPQFRFRDIHPRLFFLSPSAAIPTSLSVAHK
ncbi:hypothetical protein E2C01_101878 [Portunus trituberculatus]|uniref:Uncharacterized protein n=1 Tax=Portunus trituberculatus TaxID=210409 RepID=A0A5B7K6Q7_PORTR|nr:hypothetical protein [Portunus trituberculatus]